MKLIKLFVIVAVAFASLLCSILAFSVYTDTISKIQTEVRINQDIASYETLNLEPAAPIEPIESLNYDSNLRLYDVQPPLKALPLVLGYSLEESSIFYPEFTNPPCPQGTPKNVYSVSSDYEVTIHCSDAQYMTGPTSKVFFATLKNNKNDSPSRRTPKTYTGPFKLEPWEDYVLIRCNGAKKYNAFYHQPHFKPDAYQAALQKTEATGKKPLIILMLGLDSITRNHFYRKFKTTMDYFRSLKAEGEWEVLNFYLHNIASMNTRGNLPPMFGEVTPNEKADLPDPMGESAVWNKLRKNGFVTMVNLDGCPASLSDIIGRAPKIDHPASRLYCDLEVAGEYSYDGIVRERRCIGSELSHYYMYEYAKTFSNLYVNASQWIYLHANAGHESTGQVAESADKDVADLIKYYIDTYSESHELVVYVIGDHGKGYSAFAFDHTAMTEYRLPAFFMLARHSFLDQIPNLALRENALRLNSKKDVRESVVWLSSWYTNSSYSAKEPFSNLFTDLISTERTCEELGITSWTCVTNEAKLVPKSAYSDRNSLDADGKILYDIIQRASVFTLSTLNELRSGSTSNGVECKTLHLDSIEQVMHANHDGEKMKRVIQIDVKVKENAAVFRALLFVPGQGNIPIKTDSRQKFGKDDIAMSMISYRRLNWNSQECTNVSMKQTKYKFAKPELCICSK